jgi:hypothetical protein
MMRENSSYSFLRSLVEGQDHSFFKDLTGVFCTVGGTLVLTFSDRVFILHLLQALSIGTKLLTLTYMYSQLIGNIHFE